MMNREKTDIAYNDSSKEDKEILMFHSIEYSNLKLAVIENLWREKILSPLSIEDICQLIVGDIDFDKEDGPIDAVEEFLLSINISDEDLLKLTTLKWEKDNYIARLIWPGWDGEDDYFHIESFEGIEALKNLRSIKGNLFAFDDCEPLPLLCYLETIDIENELFTNIVSYPVMKLAPLLDILKLNSLTITAEPVAENKKAEKELLKEVPYVDIRWQEVDSETKALRLYDNIDFTTPADKKLELLNQIVELRPNIGGYYRERAHIYFRKMNDSEKALADINKAIELEEMNDFSVQNFSLRAEIYKDFREYDKAISDYTTVIDFKNDKLKDAREEILYRGRIYRVLKEYNKAIADYRLFLELYNLGTLYFKVCLELIEIYICIQDYIAAESLLKEHLMDLFSQKKRKYCRFEGIYSLLKYIIFLHTGTGEGFELNRLKELKKQWRWDYSHLELWLWENEFEERDNEVIREIIAYLKGYSKSGFKHE